MLDSIFNKKAKPDKIDIKFTKNIPCDQIQNIHLSVGWKYRDIQDIRKSLQNSVLVVSAWDGNKLIGLARATGDGVFHATIWDMAVRPTYQKQGIGNLIIKSLLDKLDDYNIPFVTLYTEYAKKDFYSKFGFELDPEKITGMYRYRR